MNGATPLTTCKLCARPPMRSHEYCWFHRSDITATERSLILSKAQHDAKLQRLDLKDIDKIESAQDVQAVLGQLILDLIHGKIATPDVVQALCNVCSVYLKALEKAKYGEELAVIYRQFRDLERKPIDD